MRNHLIFNLFTVLFILSSSPLCSMKMEINITVTSMVFSFPFATIVILTYCAWMLLNWAWLKPKKLENLLRRQGFSGNSYKLFYGDMKEMSMILKEARAKPISLSDDIAQRILPFDHHIIKKFGMF